MDGMWELWGVGFLAALIPALILGWLPGERGLGVILAVAAAVALLLPPVMNRWTVDLFLSLVLLPPAFAGAGAGAVLARAARHLREG